jgi:hypothetical protein
MNSHPPAIISLPPRPQDAYVFKYWGSSVPISDPVVAGSPFTVQPPEAESAIIGVCLGSYQSTRTQSLLGVGRASSKSLLKHNLLGLKLNSGGGNAS